MKIELEDEIIEDVLKEAFWLAWKASIVQGAGFLQDNPQATKEDVWENIATSADYPGPNRTPNGTYNADYVFGRMMKLVLWKEAGSIEFRDENPKPDYQSWCGTYPTYEFLLDTACSTIWKQK